MAVGLLALALATACAGRDVPWAGIGVDPPREIAPVAFVRGADTVYSTAPERGRPMALFFGYTHCPDVCPATLADWARAHRALGADGDRVRWIFVSVDPARDSAAAQRYAAQFDDAFVGLAGDSATTATIQAAFGVTSWEDHVSEGAQAAGGYLVTHASQTFLVDDRGRLRAMHPVTGTVDALVADLRRLLE